MLKQYFYLAIISDKLAHEQRAGVHTHAHFLSTNKFLPHSIGGGMEEGNRQFYAAQYREHISKSRL
jgi:hypothetical protein